MKARTGFLLAGGGMAATALLAYVSFARVRAQDRQRSIAAAEAARAEAEHREAQKLACGVTDGGSLHEVPSVQGFCQNAFLEQWGVPGSAAFPGMFDEEPPLTSPDGCATMYSSWVDAPARARGGDTVHQAYVCTYDPRTGKAKIELR